MLRLRWPPALRCLPAIPAILFGLSCSPSEPRFPDEVGSSSEASETARPSSEPEPHPLSDLSAFAAVGRSLVSDGHLLGRFDAQIMANELAASRLLDWVSTSRMPEGAVLVQVHSREGGRVAGPVFGMVKRAPGYFPEGNDWEWLVLGADGRPQTGEALRACARCHAEAPADGVFPLPREVRPQPEAPGSAAP